MCGRGAAIAVYLVLGKAAIELAAVFVGKGKKVLVEDDVLTISGEKHVERSDEKTHYSERSYGGFTRAFTLPSDADHEGIAANFAKGVLTLHIPKSANGHGRAKEIEIKPS